MPCFSRLARGIPGPRQVLTLILCVGFAASCLAGAEEARRLFALAAGGAEETLEAFSEQADAPVVFPLQEVRGVTTNPVHGDFAPREALQRLLAGTELEVRQDEAGTFVVRRKRPAPSRAAPARAVERNAAPTPQQHPMKTNKDLAKNKKPLAVLGAWLGLALGFGPPPTHAAADATTGVITGRVYSPSTGEYMRNAQIKIQETGQSTIARDGGEFRFDPVRPGPATLEVSFAGYRTATAVVTVTAGGVVNQEINLASALLSQAEDETIQLGRFIVRTHREGSAKAIMDQRNSMNITSNVASDFFGDNAEGNVGEFLKHLPGVELDQAYGEVRTVRLGGLGPEYTSVTMDGIALASVDANNSGSGAARSFTMEMASLNSMESIEISKTISADVDANAPAGTINLRTKRAFDRAARTISWQANVTAHSEELNLRNSRGPDEDGRSRKIRPGGIFEYSDRFFDKTLGVVLNISESNVYQEAVITSLTWNATPTAADPRPLVPTSFNFQWAPRFNKRFATTLTTDYKVSRYLDVGLVTIYNYVDLWTPQRILILNTGPRNTVVGDDPMLSISTTTAGNVQVNPVAVSKMGETFTLLPRLSYKRGNFELEAKAAYSDSTSWYNPLGRRNAIRDTNTPTATGIAFRAERTGLMAMDWRFTQLAGNDISNGASFNNPQITANDGRFGRTVLYSGEVIGTLRTSRLLPVVWKTGYKSRQQVQKFEDDQLAKRFDYAPGGATVASGAWAPYRSPWEYDLGMVGGSLTSVSGRGVFLPDLRALGDLYRSQPQNFRQNWGTNADNYYESYVARRRRYYEQIDAAFFMGTANWRGLTLRGGLRWEETSTEASEAAPRSPAEMRAAGFGAQLNAAGRGATIPAIEYQYLSRPRVKRTGEYDNLFPSASLKYSPLRNLDLQFGYSTTIRRPSYFNLAGVWLINETAQTVTSPNPQLRPETADNYAARVAYYFEPVGQIAITGTQRSVKDLIISDSLSAQEFGYTIEDELQNYRFTTYDNSPGTIRIRSLEIEYNQSLAFLGQWARRLALRGSYTRLYAEEPRANLTPHLASGGLSYAFRRFNAYTNWNWTDDMNTNLAGTTYRRHRTNLDVGAGWRLSGTYSLSVSVRNLLDTPFINMRRYPTGPTAPDRHETVGQSWTFALKGLY